MALVTADQRNSPFLDAVVARKAQGSREGKLCESNAAIPSALRFLQQPAASSRKREASSRSFTNGQLLTHPKPQFEIAEPIGYRHIRYNTNASRTTAPSGE